MWKKKEKYQPPLAVLSLTLDFFCFSFEKLVFGGGGKLQGSVIRARFVSMCFVLW